MTRLKVAIIGLGNIGLGYDKTLGEEIILTHSKAFSMHPGYDLVAGCDFHPEKRQAFELFTGAPSYSTVSELDGHCDVIAIATPPHDRQNLVESCLSLTPRLIILEKPIASNVKEARAIVELCQITGCKILVNYMRRCEPVVQNLKTDIAEGRYGEFVGGHILYTRGILGNASHFLDLFSFLIGEPEGRGVIGRASQGTLIADPNIDFWVEFNRKRCLFQAISSAEFSIGSAQFLFSKVSINYEDFGRNINFKYLEADPHFTEFNRLTQDGKRIESDFQRAQWYVATHVYRHLTEGEEIVGSGESGLQILEICDELIEQWQN